MEKTRLKLVGKLTTLYIKNIINEWYVQELSKIDFSTPSVNE
jgi:hypothetical protein